MKSYFAPISPLGVRIHTDTLPRRKRIRARARWTDPISGVRKSRSITVDNEASAYEFFSALRSHVGADLDPFITLTDYADQIGDRFLRGVDMTSTASGYRVGLRLRALPTLGHLCIRDITTGIVDRSIDSWEIEHSRSTLKSTIAALTRVLDEAVRDEIITRNPVRDRAHRRYRMREAPKKQTPIPTLTDIERIVAACAAIHQSYADHVLISALLAARSSEVAGLIVGDVDWTSKLIICRATVHPWLRWADNQTDEEQSDPPRSDHRTAGADTASPHYRTTTRRTIAARTTRWRHHYGSIA